MSLSGRLRSCLLACLLCPASLQAQRSTIDSLEAAGVDLGDRLLMLFKKPPSPPVSSGGSDFAILPSAGFNPSFGFVLGGKMSLGRQWGPEATTPYSVAGVEALYTSRNIMILQARHNVFTPGSRWNFQGHWQASRFAIDDYGLGSGNGKPDTTFLIRFNYFRFTQRVYRQVAPHLFAGGGVSFDVRSRIDDAGIAEWGSTPHLRYSEEYGFNPKSYRANGLLLNLQYNTREHPYRSFGGLYADVGLRFNQQWLGSTRNAVQLQYDIRRYISLSPRRRPDHVLALWHWASYRLSGLLPYLELPATATDTYNRSARAYTIGRFRGNSYLCFEGEYRFPITRDQFISGVAFGSLQSASGDPGDLRRLGRQWEPGAGAGFRVLVNKYSRSTLCIDYAVGRYGAKGFFFGLNEVF